MTDSFLRYDQMVEDALRGVVREALARASETGMPGDHHFYITFATHHPGVVMPDYLKARYPEEITIVLQHQFWGLEVGPDQFSVTLSFNKINERLTVPFAAVSAFADPAVKFGLQFQVERSGAPVPVTMDDADADTVADDDPDTPSGGAGGGQVIALDAFRKK